MGRRRAFAFVAVGLGAAVRAACPAHCNFRGYCSAPDATLSTSFCICQPGVTGAACEQIHCPRGDDPLTQNQVSRAIALTVTAPTGGEVDGRLRFGFLGESVLLPAVLDAATCGRAISSLPTVQKASCSQTTDGWLVTFDEWAPAPVDAHAPHGGNPALGTFECESTLPGDAWDVPQCTLKDAVASNVREHAPCSNHGDCDLATGKCRCRAGWRRDACDDNKDADTLQLYRSEGPFYSGTILGLEAKRAASPDFHYLRVGAGGRGGDVLAVRGDGHIRAAGAAAFDGGVAVAGALDARGPATFSGGAAFASAKGDLLVAGPADAPALRVAKDQPVAVGRAGLASEGPGSFGSLTVAGAVAAAGVTLEGGVATADALVATAGATARGAGAAPALRLERRDGDGPIVAAFRGTNEVFAVRGDGALDVLAGGVRVTAGGLRVHGGGVDVGAGGLRVDGGLEVRSGALTLRGGLALEDGGVEAASRAAGGAPLRASATHAQFGGSVLTLEAPALAPPTPFARGAARLVDGVVKGQSVFSVDASGALVARGGVRSAGGAVFGGDLAVGGAVRLQRTEAKAGARVAVPAGASYVEILEDGRRGSGNAVSVEGDGGPDARQLVVRNSDGDAATLDGHVVPAGSTRVFYQGGDRRWAAIGGDAAGAVAAAGAAVTRSSVTEFVGVSRLDAAADLDVGPHAVRAGRLSSRTGDSQQNGVVFYGPKGFLDADADFISVDRVKGGPKESPSLRLRVGRLPVRASTFAAAPSHGRTPRRSLRALVATCRLPCVRPRVSMRLTGSFARRRLMVTTSVDAPLHMGGHAIKDARIEGGSATGLAQVAAQVLRLDHAPGTKSNPPEGFERPVLVGPGGALGATPELYYRDRTLHVERLGAATIVGDLDFANNARLKNARIEGGSVEGLEKLAVEELTYVDAPARGAAAVFGEDGALVAADAWCAAGADHAVAIPRLAVGALAGDVDARGHVIRDGQFEGGGAAGLEFVAADVVLVGSLDASRRALVVAGDGGALEAEDGLYVDADAAVHAPRNVNVGGALDVKSDAFVGGSVVVGGTVMGSGAYIDSSDARFKRDLAVLDGAACLGALRNGSLGAYAFSYKRDEFPARNFPARRDVGFVAQRVEEAFPSLVYDDADGFKHVAYGRAAPVLAAALAALAAKHDGLERRVARLEALLVGK